MDSVPSPLKPALCVLQMNKNRLKTIAIIIGLLSLIQVFLHSVAFISIIKAYKPYWGKMLFGNILYSYLLLSPLSVFGLLVSSVGLFLLKRWGFILANISLSILIVGLAIVAIGTINPDLLDFSVKLNESKYISFLPAFNNEAFFDTFIASAVLLAINLKSTRLLLK